MADREDQPPPPLSADELSADEADRLSERFHASWEAPVEPARGQALAPTTPAEPRKAAAKQTLLGGVSPIALQPPPDAPKPGPSRPPQQTLVGIAPVSAPPPISKAPTSSPVTAGGSPDGPSGIAKLYVPKDDPSGPAVMLTEEVQQAEAAATAELEARRRIESSRHMQTIVNMKAPDLPGPAPRPKRKSGMWQLLLGAAAGVAVVAAVFKLTTKESVPPVEPAVLSESQRPQDTANPVPAPTAPPAAPPTAAAAEPGGPVVTPVTPAEEGPAGPVVLPAETASGDSVDRASRSGETASPRAPSKPVGVAPAPKKAAPKPSKPSAKETSPPAKGGVIVRDSPF